MMPGRLVHPYFGCVQINIKEKRDIMQKIAVCVSGGGTNLQAIIDSIADGIIKNTEISVVISNKKDAAALGRAEKAGIPALCISPKEYGDRDRIINIHPSLIPAHCGMGYYGLKVHESVLAAGNKVTGATVHFVDEKADHGPIILQKAVDVCEGDTPEILQKRVMEQAEWKILPEAVNLIGEGRVYIKDNIAHIK